MSKKHITTENTRMTLQRQRWSALLSWGISGCVVPSVRRHGQRTRIDAAAWPTGLREYLELHDPQWPHRSAIDRATFDGLAAHDEIVRVQPVSGLQKRVTFDITLPVPDPPAPIRGAHVIRSLDDLCAYFGADARGLNRRVYKDTDCGASISVLPTVGPWRHNGEDWSDITEIVAFTLQTIVEGSDATVDSDPFWLPVREREVKDWIAQMEARADELWQEANGSSDDDVDTAE